MTPRLQATLRWIDPWEAAKTTKIRLKATGSPAEPEMPFLNYTDGSKVMHVISPILFFFFSLLNLLDEEL